MSPMAVMLPIMESINFRDEYLFGPFAGQGCLVWAPEPGW